MPERTLIGPPHAHMDAPCTDKCYETASAEPAPQQATWTAERCGCDEEPSSEATCHRCGGPNIVWAAPSPLWNVVMRGGSIGGQDKHDGIICPTCFAVLAEAEDLAGRWRLYAESVTPDLEAVTPDGRVWDDKAWLWVDPAEPQQPDASALLDLVRQYAGAYANQREAPYNSDSERLNARAAGALFDRIAALVPPSAPDFLASINKLTIERDEARADLGESRGQARAMAATAERFHAAILRSEEERERADHDLMSALDVDRLDEVLPAIERLRTARPDPSVLSLPQVPPGTVALIGAESGKRYVQSFAGGSWTDEETAQVMPLWRVLEREGSVTVVMREPRTWPRLNGPDDDPAVRGASGRIWRRVSPTVWACVDVEDGEECENFAALQQYDGPLTEVFEDEPGGEPR